MNVILCGLPMCGKTTIGNSLATRLKKNFIDTDRLIEDAYYVQTGLKYTCREIHMHEGDIFFRELEKLQVSTLASYNQCVIATGGGVFLHEENVKILHASGRVIYLHAQPQVLWQRRHQRAPMAFLDASEPEKAFYEMAEARMPIYKKAAHLVIETEQLDLEDIVDEIVTAL